ncbi:MAG: hypothetical protein K2X76_03600 [Sphingomonas sp.]|nr:hypothetical protein [Sphingomonas sp.]
MGAQRGEAAGDERELFGERRIERDGRGGCFIKFANYLVQIIGPSVLAALMTLSQ